MTLSATERQVIQSMRALSKQGNEWRLVISRHERQQQSYVQLEATVFSRQSVGADAFVAVE